MRSLTVLAIACAFVWAAGSVGATVYEPPTQNVTPVNQSNFGVRIWVRAGISRCAPAEDIWVRVPKFAEEHPFRELTLRVNREDGEINFLANLAVTSHPPGGKIFGGVLDHPLRDPTGFHGSVFCLAPGDLPRAEVLLDYGKPSEPVAYRLRVSNLEKWLAR